MWRHRNPWGGFVFRAYWLNHHAPQPASLIGITIKHQEPLPLKLLRQLERLPPLSSRQTQVCLLLAAGHSRPAIARRLDISDHTAITYTRQVYSKLEVHNRGELLNKLLLL
ncbi:MAG: helix-turn-helix transcriptional regulator [Gammaproteobacteria bacterium]|nr:helix-turn-helix transcriptional regulator [Gammaproteobacteria bacterium]MBA3731082.1 helix-turn-helix transcriptional regulator [Gammaproteobacteria bacterium]